MSHTIRRTWKVNGVLTDVESALLSDPTETFGVKRNDTGETVVADGTAMEHVATGTYEYTFESEAGITYTAFTEIVHGGATYRFEEQLPAAGGAGGGAAGPGSRPLTWEILKPDSSPAIGAEAWISTDSAGVIVVAGTFIADDSGIARVPGGTGLPMLDDDVVYYGWLDSSEVQFATNPIQFRYSSSESRWEIWNGAAYEEWT